MSNTPTPTPRGRPGTSPAGSPSQVGLMHPGPRWDLQLPHLGMSGSQFRAGAGRCPYHRPIQGQCPWD